MFIFYFSRSIAAPDGVVNVVRCCLGMVTAIAAAMMVAVAVTAAAGLIRQLILW